MCIAHRGLRPTPTGGHRWRNDLLGGYYPKRSAADQIFKRRFRGLRPCDVYCDLFIEDKPI